ncbi:hypothetical protein CEXT_390771 [Caerostris extrusa]|uniref:Secreted protein n=1 Tax=Caerostris extrusa TaxID=172846 RepID=A0AAV4W6M6_CAEEX|nr:hypothetical protein CEXT_390771 [Caerostris extrusa]
MAWPLCAFITVAKMVVVAFTLYHFLCIPNSLIEIDWAFIRPASVWYPWREGLPFAAATIRRAQSFQLCIRHEQFPISVSLFQILQGALRRTKRACGRFCQ